MGVEELLQVLGTVSWHGLVAYLVSANLVSPHRWERFAATTVADASAPLSSRLIAGQRVLLSHAQSCPRRPHARCDTTPDRYNHRR